MNPLRALLPAVAALLFAAPVLDAQAPMEDVLWVASRGATKLFKISRFGKVEQTVDMASNGFTVSKIFRAPDGKLWLVNYYSSTFTILDRAGKILKNVTTTGRAYAIAFDKTGNAWISGATTDSVDKYSPTGVFIKSYFVGASPLGITIDYSTPAQAGNVWVAHRTGPPGFLSKIDIKTGLITKVNMPSTSMILPVHILADYQGITQPSTIWVGGDDRGDKKIYQLANTGKLMNAYSIFTSGYITGFTLDRNNDIWICTSTKGVYKVQGSTGKVLTSFTLTNSVGGITMDSIGRPWVVDRFAAGGAEIQRLGLASGKIEVTAKVGTNTYGITDPAGFSYAFVTNPFGDEDKDSIPNFVEITNGTSPYDPLSNSTLSFDTQGVSRLNSTPYLDVVSSTPGAMIVLFGRRLGPSITIPSITGQLGLDLTGLIGFVNMTAPGKLNLPIPNDPALVDQVLRLQAAFAAGTTQTFSNLSGIKISP